MSENHERLQKTLARAGIASRRKAETMIAEGRVTVNGQVITELGTKVDPARDDIRVDGQRLRAGTGFTYVLVNKPRGVLSAMEDDRGRRSLAELVPLPMRLYPVGRLDVNSEGLMLLTDDGELANLLTHPRYGHDKEYRVTVMGRPTDKTLDAWRRGVVLEGRQTAPARVEVARRDRDTTLLYVTMHEGRKRQIREVAGLLGHPVRQLVRVRIGPLQLNDLEPGQRRYLTPRELADLQALKRPAGKARRPSPPVPDRPPRSRPVRRPASPRPAAQDERKRAPGPAAPSRERQRAPATSRPTTRRRRESGPGPRRSGTKSGSRR